MLLFTIESSRVYIHNVALKSWRISRGWAVAVSVFFFFFFVQSVESDVAMDRWYHQTFLTFHVIRAYFQVRNGAKGYITCVV